MRGKSANISAASGRACSSSEPALRNRRRTGCSRTPNCMVIIAVIRASTATPAQAAVSIDCEWKKLVMSRKKHRKITTKRSRRARISMSFRPRNSTSSTTPGSRPSRVR
jgi:hypothetical protein